MSKISFILAFIFHEEIWALSYSNFFSFHYRHEYYEYFIILKIIFVNMILFLFAGPCHTSDPDSTKFLNFDGNCYVSYETENKKGINWFQAQNHCYLKGGNLAIFPNFTAQRLEKVFKRFTKPMENYWVGLVKHTWEWRHNSG